MFPPKFEVEQRTFNVAGVEVGGQPSDRPTVLIASIFYQGHRIVEDEVRGIFDREEAERLLNRVEELSDWTKNPYMVDVVSQTAEAMKRYIEYVSEITDAPLLIDSTSPAVRIEGAEYSAEVGLLDRVVYNSILHSSGNVELEKLRALGVKSAILLAWNPRNPLPRGRIDILRGREGLLAKARRAGVENILVDVGVLDIPSIGLAAEAVQLVKAELGLPSGGGPSNAILEWKRIKELGRSSRNYCMAAAIGALQYAGADFVLIGPIEKAEVTFPAAALADALVAYAARWGGMRPKTRSHPLFNIF